MFFRRRSIFGPEAEPFCIVGLGNPGQEYASTRHNVGFLVLDALARRVNAGRFRLSHGGYSTECYHGEKPLLLLKPWMYMNRSGIVVAEYLRLRDIPHERMLVISDDVALPLGTLRFRLRGSAGGHNGISSINEEIGTRDFARLRCGIGSPEQGMDLAAYVLGSFTDSELALLQKMTDRASDAVLSFLDEGPARTMNIYNTVSGSNSETDRT